MPVTRHVGADPLHPGTRRGGGAAPAVG